VLHRPQRHLFLGIALALFIGSALGAPSRAAAAPAPAASPFRYFKETGHNIGARIKTFYETKGGIATFGLPLTEVIQEGNLQVQYFERAKFELHPEFEPSYYVSLTQLGRALVEGRTEEPFLPRAGADSASVTFFPQTGHTVQLGFRAYWLNNGGLQIFGYPLSEEFSEVSPDDGQTYTVQYFERAKFEYHPETPNNTIQISRLGAQAMERAGVPEAARQRKPAIEVLSTATTGYYGSIAERVNNIARGAARMNGLVIAPGATFSFNQALGSAGTEDGFVEGYAIVAGKLEKVTGGGLCQISTTMYRAVFNAGLDIVERYPHSFVINFYENIDGFDATVFSPTVDFKWRNDTGGPIYMFAGTDPAKATATFTLYGFNDGRSAKMIGPTSKNVKLQGIANWQYDPSLKRGQVVQLVHGRPGKEVTMQRVVTAANGKVLHNDRLNSKYRPWEDFFVYGPGVTPPKGANIIAPKAAATAK
jgi:hypothetical protein